MFQNQAVEINNSTFCEQLHYGTYSLSGASFVSKERCIAVNLIGRQVGISNAMNLDLITYKKKIQFYKLVYLPVHSQYNKLPRQVGILKIRIKSVAIQQVSTYLLKNARCPAYKFLINSSFRFLFFYFSDRTKIII